MKLKIAIGVLCLASLTGCLHGRGVHYIPVERDYQNLACVKIEDARPVVDKAHRVGSGHFAPYEYHSAAHYLAWAIDARGEGDCKGEKDYSGLAKMFAEKAIELGSGVEDKGVQGLPGSLEEAQEEFNRLKARYLELDHCKARLVAPVTLAHIESQLANAEHELNEKCHYIEAARCYATVEADIDAIWAHDHDGDGVKDMQDGEPWIPEDADSFQDEDGMPEPKPYPVLEPVHFAVDSAKINEHAKGYLDGVADMIFNGYKEVTLHITGHTDSDASDEYNLGLSQRRAQAVADYLRAAGLPNEMVVSAHKGESSPAADNTSAAGKAKNRRVEIVLDSPDPVSPYCN